MEYYYKNSTATLADIEAFAKAFDFTVPNDFVNFCLTDNGGKLGSWQYEVPQKYLETWKELALSNGRSSVMVNSLLGVGVAHSDFSVERQTIALRKMYNLPQDLIAIGIDHFGNAYCLGDDVTYFLREECVTYAIAETFREFICGLSKQDIERIG